MIRKVRMRHIRKKRGRRKIFGTKDKPRMTVYRSNKNIYVQVIDDLEGKTICATSTLNQDMKPELDDLSKIEQAKKVGIKIAELCKENKVKTVVFDKSGFRYHGRVRSLAEGAREGGIDF
ncbi:MAG: 50S ribosomal protein L18 [Deltaproteobacteria bacterium]|jgi:large subunit ribosomal protein L18|nr:50S ribosomal protein L18 [Deltaproteobacteria bacterium]